MKDAPVPPGMIHSAEAAHVERVREPARAAWKAQIGEVDHRRGQDVSLERRVAYMRRVEKIAAPIECASANQGFGRELKTCLTNASRSR